MIIDDSKLIMGSANINDRSLLGNRDSEIAVFIEGPRNKQVTTAGVTSVIMVNDTIHDFRKRLFEEHFGVDIDFLTANDSWSRLYRIASQNTMFYNEVFKTYPSNEYADFPSLASRMGGHSLDPEKFYRGVQKVSGHAVLYPYHFLRNEDLIGGTNGEVQLLVVPLYALQ